MTIRLVCAVVVVVLGVAAPAWPCSVRGILTTEQMVDQAQVIVRARAEATLPASGHVRFTVLEIVKGQFAQGQLAFEGRLEDKNDRNDHGAPYNLVRRSGRASCHAYGYKAGTEYLLFLHQPDRPGGAPGSWTPYWAALSPTNEPVSGADDKWVRWVLERVKGQGKGEQP